MIFGLLFHDSADGGFLLSITYKILHKIGKHENQDIDPDSTDDSSERPI